MLSMVIGSEGELVEEYFGRAWLSDGDFSFISRQYSFRVGRFQFPSWTSVGRQAKVKGLVGSHGWKILEDTFNVKTIVILGRNDHFDQGLLVWPFSVLCLYSVCPQQRELDQITSRGIFFGSGKAIKRSCIWWSGARWSSQMGWGN